MPGKLLAPWTDESYGFQNVTISYAEKMLKENFSFPPASLHLGKAICLVLAHRLWVTLTLTASIPGPPKTDSAWLPPLIEGRDSPKIERDRISEC